jgi:hypothetical protein
MQSIDELRRGVRDWLVDHELCGDTAFYTRAEWKARKEPFLADSELILAFEGALYRVMNGCDKDSIKLYDEFQGFVRGFGYFFELGHAWNMGFYPLPIIHSHPRLDQSVAPTPGTHCNV